MSVYTKQHYEDVARILSGQRGSAISEGLGRIRNSALADAAVDFADLFAADNPQACIDCGARRDEADPGGQCVNHLFADGFNRERFLAACGLEPKRAEPRHLGFHQ